MPQPVYMVPGPTWFDFLLEVFFELLKGLLRLGVVMGVAAALAAKAVFSR